MDYATAMAAITNPATPLRPVYLLYGGETYLAEQLLAAVQRRLIPPGAEDFNLHRLGPGPDQVTQALSVAQTLPFLGQHRLVIVVDAPFFAGRRGRTGDDSAGEEDRGGDGTDALLAYLERPPEFTCLVFTAGESVDTRRKATRAIMSRGAVVECRPLKAAEAATWVQSRAGDAGKRMTMEAAQLLVEKAGTDLRTLAGELEKLILYVGGAAGIAPADVSAIVAGTAEAEIWGLIDAVAERRTGAALVQLEAILRGGEPPLRLLFQVGRHFRLLLQARALASRGVSPEKAAAAAHQSPYYWRKLMRQARGYRREQLVAAMERLLEADLAQKSGYDPRLALETLLVDLSRG